METARIRLDYRDRPGLVWDAAGILLKYNLNIIALQLMDSTMYVEIDACIGETWLLLKSDLENVPAVLHVERVPDMPYQSREKQFTAIMNSISKTDLPIKGDPFAKIIGVSEPIKEVIALARQVAKNDVTVLIRGESGTGKELFAKAIHLAGKRKEQVFVPVNCGAIPDNLLESELFGYLDGAFSGAKKGGRVGLFQFANGGTLFLDEIGELPLQLQVKLLRVLQEKTVRPLGSNEESPIHCRIIAATNKKLEDLIQEERFRKDLYYRLNVIPLYIPPLRQRLEDIHYIAEHILEKHETGGDSRKKLSMRSLDKLMSYAWPGNVRELENVLERASALTPHAEIESQHIIFDTEFDPKTIVAVKQGLEDLSTATARIEKDLLVIALQKNKSLRQTAKVLGVSHTTIANKMKKYGLNSEAIQCKADLV